LSGIKKLASQTLWYGVPTIFTRFLSYGLSLLAFRYGATVTGNLTLIYAIIPFLNVLFTYGLETSFFRYANIKDKKTVYNTLSVSIIATTLVFTLLLILFSSSIVQFFDLESNPQYVKWMIWILFFDTLAVLPFCKLRNENRPKKFAYIKIINIVVNVGFVLFFVVYLEKLAISNPNHFLVQYHNPNLKVGYFILANLVASIVTLIFLYKELFAIRFSFDKILWKEIMLYSYPLIIVGFGGMINEMLSRVIYKKVTVLSELAAERELGIFGANFKLAVLVTIFIQVFRMAAEPFFFKKANDLDAKKTYARVMKFFVIACCFMFLFVALFLKLWQNLIAYKHTEYAEGIYIVPILALGYLFLGIYYNLSVWFKLTNKNKYGAYITLIGVLITIVLNFILIPYFSYWGSAWVELICYGTMMVLSFKLGQKHYKIPYAWKKLVAYIFICIVLYFIHELIYYFAPNSMLIYIISALVLIAAFAWFIIQIERKELLKIPYLNKFIKST
jgi:O-antigen/teichoic acid export membrane protein